MARPGESSYEISRSSGVCAATGRQFQAGESYIAALVEREGEEGLGRVDYSLEAWERGARPRPPWRMFGFWRSRFEPGDTKRRPLIDDESLVDLFEQLDGADDPSRQGFRYILALLLVRKKLLRLEGVRREDGRPVMLLRRAGAPDAPPYEVLDTGMDDAQVAQAIEQLGTVMAE